MGSNLLGYQSSPDASESLYGTDQYLQDMGYSLDTVSLFPNDPWNLTSQYFQQNAGETMFPDDCLNLDAASSDASKAPSLYDGESFVQSPTSPTFSSAMSVCSGAVSLALSPETLALDSNTPSAYNDETMSVADSDEVLENLLGELEPSEDGKYHCYNVQAEDHCCDFVADRKCMLRKHLESTLKTNICRHPDCRSIAFSSKAVLTRHEKEAHGMHSAHQYFCPVDSCERAKRGFPREYNMGDHILRVHRDLDVNAYLKKTKRSRKHSGTSTSGSSTMAPAVSSAAPGASNKHVVGVRKNPNSKHRREKLEKQYHHSRDNIGKLYVKMTAQSGVDVHKYIQQMKTELMRLEDAATALGASND